LQAVQALAVSEKYCVVVVQGQPLAGVDVPVVQDKQAVEVVQAVQAALHFVQTGLSAPLDTSKK
jgi:hypothetical protein